MEGPDEGIGGRVLLFSHGHVLRLQVERLYALLTTVTVGICETESLKESFAQVTLKISDHIEALGQFW
jgi:hypothetical protein